MFFFTSWERNEQRGVVATNVLEPDFAHLSRITPSPFYGNQFSLRFDGRITNVHTAFVRYSHEGVRSLGPTTPQPTGYPSAWTRQPAWVDQSVLGVTSVFGGTLVNDFRFSYFYVSAKQFPAGEQGCPGCLGAGAPSITVSDSVTEIDLSVGSSSYQQIVGRRFHVADTVTSLRGKHRIRLGMDWEHNRDGTTALGNEPATLTLYSPERARLANLPVPSFFRTLDDLLQLPLRTVTVEIGSPQIPQSDGGLVHNWHTLRLFIHDIWRANSRLSLNFGLGWNMERRLNYDLHKPALLAPILGEDGLGPTRKEWRDFSPVAGLAWALGSNGKAVIRGGAGVYYDFNFGTFPYSERVLLGPPGLGRQTIPGSSIYSCLPGTPGVSGAILHFPNAPTRFTGADLIKCLPTIRADLVERLSNFDKTIQSIQLTKAAPTGLNTVNAPTPSAAHASVGIQSEIARDFVVSADLVHRRFSSTISADLNHFDSVRGPVIRKCLPSEIADPQALCSNGAIEVAQPISSASYTGLLVRAEKRFSRGFQFLGSWAFSSNSGYNTGSGFNLDDLLGSYGPLDRDFTHILNLSGILELPWHFQLGANFSYSNRPPFSAFVGGIDFNGDGTTNDLLPGTTVNVFNRGAGRLELEKLVEEFNVAYAGKVDSRGTRIRRITLPPQYWFGDSFQSLDLRLSRSFVFDARWHLMLIGEVFNVYNAANLTGHRGNLTASGFGQPTNRVTQVFGSGGPRSFQLGLRLSF